MTEKLIIPVLGNARLLFLCKVDIFILVIIEFLSLFKLYI